MFEAFLWLCITSDRRGGTLPIYHLFSRSTIFVFFFITILTSVTKKGLSQLAGEIIYFISRAFFDHVYQREALQRVLLSLSLLMVKKVVCPQLATAGMNVINNTTLSPYSLVNVTHNRINKQAGTRAAATSILSSQQSFLSDSEPFRRLHPVTPRYLE